MSYNVPHQNLHVNVYFPALPLPKTEKSAKVSGKSGDDTLFSGDEPIDARHDL